MPEIVLLLTSIVIGRSVFFSSVKYDTFKIGVGRDALVGAAWAVERAKGSGGLSVLQRVWVAPEADRRPVLHLRL